MSSRRAGVRPAGWAAFAAAAIAVAACGGPKAGDAAVMEDSRGDDASGGPVLGGGAPYTVQGEGISPSSTPADASAEGAAPIATDGSAPVAAISASPVDFWQVACGAASTRSVAVDNTGSATLTVDASAPGAPFEVTPAQLSVAPGTSGTFTVTATVPADSTAGAPLTATLELSTNDPTTPSVAVPLSVTPFGATLVFSTTDGLGGSPAPSSANFGAHPLGENAQTYATIALNLMNLGNAPAVVSLEAPDNPAFALHVDWPYDTALPDGGAATLPAAQTDELTSEARVQLSASFAPTALGPLTASSPVLVQGATCGPSVTSIAYSGEGTASGVSGWPTPPVLYLGGYNGPPCVNLNGPTFSFVLHNAGVAGVTITSFTSADPGFTTDAPAGAVIPAGGSLPVGVTMAALSARDSGSDYESSFTFTTSALGDVPHTLEVIADCP